MKKNLSFQKLGLGLAAVALVSSTAFAAIKMVKKAPAIDETTDIWVVPNKAIAVGDQVTFIGFNEAGIARQLKTDGSMQDLNASTNVLFTALQSASTEYALKFANEVDATGKPTTGTKYLFYDGTVNTNDDNANIQWKSTFTSATEQGLESAATKWNLYYDKSSDKFKTSKDAVSFAAFKKGTVKNTTISDNGVENTTTPGLNCSKVVDGGVTYLRYDEAKGVNPVITIADTETEQTLKLQWAVTTSASAPASGWEYQDAKPLTAKVIFDLAPGTTVYVHSRAAVMAGENVLSYTNDVYAKYCVQGLEAIKFNPASSITVDAAGKANVEVSSKGAYTVEATYNGTTASGTGAQTVNVAPSVGSTAEITATATSGKFTVTGSANLSVAPNLNTTQVAELFGGFKAESNNVKDKNKAVAGNVITFWFEKPAYTKFDTYSIAPATSSFTVKINGVDATATAISGGKATVTVPSTVTTTDAVELRVPAKCFQATSGTNTYMQPSPETAKFNSVYDGKTFSIDPVYNNISDQDAANFEFTVKGIDASQIFVLKKSDVYSTDMSQTNIESQVKVTKVDNTPLTGYTMTYDSSTKKFKLNFATNPGAGDYLVVFPAGTLVDAATPTVGTTHTNKYNVTAYINIKEYVNFKYTVVGSKHGASDYLCENENVSIKIETNTASGEHPDFTDAAGKTYVSGSTIPVTVDFKSSAKIEGEDWTYAINADLYESNYNKNTAAYSNTVKVFKHLTYAGSTAVPADVNAASVDFTITAKDYAGTNFSEVLKTTSPLDVEINGKATTMTVDATGKATLVLPTGTDKLAAGTYTITFPAGTWQTCANDPCKSNEFKQDITLGTVSFAINCNAEINTKSTEFEIESVKAGIGSATADATPTETSVDVLENGTKVGTLNPSTKKVTLDSPATAGEHTYTLKAGSYKYMSSTLAGTETFKVNVHNYITYSIVDTETYKEESKANTSVTFKLKLSPDTDAPYSTDAFIPTFVDAETASSLTGKLTLNDGASVIEPSAISAPVATSTPGVFEVTVTFATKLVPNNYVLNIAKNGVGAKNGANANDKDLYVKFQVFKPVTFAGTTTNVKSASTVVLNNVNVAKDDENVDRTSELNVAAGAAWTLTGTGAPEIEKVTIVNGVITLETKADLPVGTYTLTAPAGAFTIDASKNAAPVVFTVNVIDLVFAIEDVTMNAYGNTLPKVSNPKFAVKAYSVAADGTKTPVELEAFSGLPFYSSSAPSVLVDNAKDPAYNELQCVWDATNKKATIEEQNQDYYVQNSDYTLTIPAESLTGTYQGIVFTNAAALTATLKVVNDFEFVVDPSGTSTPNSALPSGPTTCDIKYSQKFSADRQAISLPFDVPYSVIKAAGAKVERIKMIYEVGTQSQWVIEELGDGETMYAQKPYLITYEKGKTLKFTVKGGELQQVSSGGSSVLECSSTTTNYQFFMAYKPNTLEGTNNENWFSISKTYTPTPDETLRFRVKNSTGTLGYFNWTKAQGDLYRTPVWSWYASSNSKGIDYAKFVDADELDATAINAVESADEAGEMYNVAGQRVNNARKGQIVIKNGKKIVNK